jgi:hypothetical protein
MSKRHQSSRRRTYGRRLHELHERPDRPADLTGWLEAPELQETSQRWVAEPADHEASGRWLQARGIN